MGGRDDVPPEVPEGAEEGAGGVWGRRRVGEGEVGGVWGRRMWRLVWGEGFGFGVWGLGCVVWGFGFRIWGLES